jgi:hypothetical protein
MKSPDLHLTRDEHQALVALAIASGSAVPIPAPVSGGVGDKLATTTRLLRYLEERCGQWVPTDEVAAAIGVTVDELPSLLTQIRDEEDWVLEERGVHGAITGVELDEDLDTAGVEPPQNLRLAESADVLGQEATLDPQSGTGQLGLFAYSPHEVEQRLKLIRAALSDGDLDEHAEELLYSAKFKLQRWNEHLQVIDGDRLS